MLRLFRINDPYRLILAFLILMLIRLAWTFYGLPLSFPIFKWILLGNRLAEGYTMYSETLDYTGPLSAMVYKGIALLFGYSVWPHMVLSSVLITIQASTFNAILLRNKAFDENTYVPAFLYIIIVGGTMDFFALSPQLMSITFIILALNNIFRRIDNQVTDDMFLHSGLYLGLSLFFYLPSIIYFFTFLIALILFSTAIPRRLILLIYGSMVILVIIWSFFFWKDAAGEFLNSFFTAGLKRPKAHYLNYREFISLSGVLLGIFVISITIFFSERFTNFQQKMQQVIFLFVLSTLLVIVISPELSGSELILFAPFLSFFLSHFLLRLKKRLWRLIVPDLFIFVIVLYPFYWIDRLAPESIFVDDRQAVEGERLLVIGDQLSQYHGNEMASPFLDSYLSRKKLNDLTYYQEATSIYHLIENSEATVIVDEWELMPEMLRMFPGLEEKYELQPEGYYLRISN